jgi:hypothetical protein
MSRWEKAARGTLVPERIDMTIRDDDVAGTEPASGQGPVEPEAADPPEWDAAEWYGRMLVDVDGKNLGKLQDVYVDVETDEPQFGTIKEGFFDRHLTFVPLVGIHVGPDYLQVQATADQVKSAPDIERHGEALSPEAESALYHHFQLNYFAPDTTGGRRLVRR